MRKSLALAAVFSLAAVGLAHAQIQPPSLPGVPGLPKPTNPYAPVNPYAAPRPIPSTPSMKPFGPAPEPFKPFKGTHTESNRGGLDPYPHKKPRGQVSTYDGGPF